LAFFFTGVFFAVLVALFAFDFFFVGAAAFADFLAFAFFFVAGFVPFSAFGRETLLNFDRTAFTAVPNGFSPFADDSPTIAPGNTGDGGNDRSTDEAADYGASDAAGNWFGDAGEICFLLLFLGHDVLVSLISDWGCRKIDSVHAAAATL
jgi:hypothetical protein